MTLSSIVEQAQYHWMEKRLRDKHLDEAWAKVHQQLFSGGRRSLEAAIQTILKQKWLEALSRFIEVNDFDELAVIPSFSSQDQSIIAYILLYCREKTESEYWLSEAKPQQLDLLWMLAAGMETLYEIPDWMIEPLFMASIATRSLAKGSYSIGQTGTMAFEDERVQTVHIRLMEMGRFPVSQFLYNVIMDDNPSQSLGWNHPVDTISWTEALQFCNRLSEAVELNPVYELGTVLKINENANGFRLPTTEEWEVSARYNSDTPFSGSEKLSEVAWRDMQSSQPIARLKPNSLGLFDMSGSVWQWCQNHDENYAARKGGSWLSEPRACEVWFQSRRLIQYASVVQGFRVCRTNFAPPDPPKQEPKPAKAPKADQASWEEDSWGNDDW